MKTRHFAAAAALSSLVSLALSGCQMFQSSEAWNTVMNTKIPGRGDPSQSEAYARQLQHALTAKGIESKIVTFRYSVRSRSDGKGTAGADAGEREYSVLIYRNETTPQYPWWLMDNSLSAPVWLPNAPLETQLRSAGRRPAEIIAVRDSAGSKEVAMAAKAPAAESAPTEQDWDYLFRRVHGSHYDPASPVDREKMAALKEKCASYIIRAR